MPSLPIENPNSGKNQTPNYNGENASCEELSTPHGGDISKTEPISHLVTMSTSTGSSIFGQVVGGDLDEEGWVVVDYDHCPSPVISPPPEMEWDPEPAPMLYAYIYGGEPWNGMAIGGRHPNSNLNISQTIEDMSHSPLTLSMESSMEDIIDSEVETLSVCEKIREVLVRLALIANATSL